MTDAEKIHLLTVSNAKILETLIRVEKTLDELFSRYKSDYYDQVENGANFRSAEIAIMSCGVRLNSTSNDEFTLDLDSER